MPCLAVVIVAAAALVPPSAAPPDTLSPSARVWRRFEEIVVRARREDPFATHSARRIDRGSLIHLPIDRLADALALQTGVVAQGGALHVRGGRAGEAPLTVEGMPLVEPFRGAPLELPLSALESVELQTGAIEARHPGALAGVAVALLAPPPGHPALEAQWRTAPGARRRQDRLALRAGTPLPRTGLGIAGDLEATLEDAPWPNLRTLSDYHVLGSRFGWRADDRLLGHARLATLRGDTRLALDFLAGRRIERPFDPAWSLDGWMDDCPDPPFCIRAPIFSPEPRAGFTRRYRAADHLVMTDSRHRAFLFGASRPWAGSQVRATLGWLRTRELTSVGGHDDESYLVKERFPLYGREDSPDNDPFHVYDGDEPYYRRRVGEREWGQLDWGRTLARGRASAGAGGARSHLAFREVDLSSVGLSVDSIRVYRATVPEAFAWGQVRWMFEGLVLNAGMRAERFSAGRGTGVPVASDAPRPIWSLSPRLGVAYPVSVRDVFSLAYARIQQAPAADLLFENRTMPTNEHPLGNPALVPATVITYEAAVRHLFDRGWSVQASTFFRDLYDLIGSAGIPGPPRWVPWLMYQNVDEAQVTGYEMALRHESTRARGALTYTWMDARGTLSREDGVPYGPLIGQRAVVLGQHPLDWDRRHTVALTLEWMPDAAWSLAWATEAGSGLPWTPRKRRVPEADISRENSRRFRPSETSAFAMRWAPRLFSHRLTAGLDVRNVFDSRHDLAATTDGYPNTLINTRYDDYGAYRTETGLGGGAYWNDRDGDGRPGWVPVHDPRLMSEPRSVRTAVSIAY